MTIQFDILDSERDIIAEEYGYTEKLTKISKDEFVSELFKDLGRTCIISKVKRDISVAQDAAKQAALDSAKISISF